MTDSPPDPPDLDPAALAASDFTRTRRGLEATEVRATLGRAADALRTWKVRDDQQSRRIAELESELEASRELDESRIVSVLGEETARIVSAAREAAAEIREKAEEQAARLLADSDARATATAEALTNEATRLRDEAARLHDDAATEAARVRDEADTTAQAQLADATERSEEMIARSASVLAEKTQEAEAHAAELGAAATAALEDAHAVAAAARATAQADATELVERARETGREMIAEVRQARERMLADLAERRRSARRQIEGALAGRDRIVEVLAEAGAQVGATIEGLERVTDDANEAASAAAASVDGDLDAELDELRDGLEAADPLEFADAPAPEAPMEHVAAETVVEATEVVVETTDVAATGDAPGPGVEHVDAAEGAVGTDERTAAPDIERSADARADGDEDHDHASEVGEGGEGGEGATVHDLFAKIRAEGLGDDESGGDESVGDESVGDESVGDESVSDQQVGDGDEGAAVAASDSNEPQIDLTDAENPAPQETAPEDGAPLADSAIFDRRDELLVPVEKSISRVLKRLASDEQNEILDRLRRVKRGRPDPADILPSAGTDETAWVDALGAEFSHAIEVGQTFWSELAGSSVESLFGDDDGAAVLTERVGAFLALHRAHLERVFSESEEQGQDASELGDRIRASYRDWRSTSLADLAGDLATAGFTYGERRAAGPGTPWRWMVDNGGLPCADGEDNALGGVVLCDEPFPTGDLTPPAHPGCRCILAPADR